MGNSQINYLKDPNLNKFKGQFSKVELYMLALLFKDLSARQHGVIDKETFLQFFPLTGLWGERLFEKFDLKHTGHIDFIEFVQGIATCCHSTEDEKIHLLFSLYDWDQDGFIKKKEMITMLYNYPKNHIKFITDEIAPDGGEKLARVTEAKRQSLGNLDDDGYSNNMIPMSATGANIRKASIQSVDSDNVAGALNDELVVAEEQQGFDKVCVERNIKQSFAYFAQKEQNEREIAIRMSQNLDALASPANGRKTVRKDLSLDTQSVPKKTSGNLAPLEVPMDSAVRKYSYDKDKAPSKSNNEAVPNSGLALRKGRRSSASTIIMDQSFVLATTVNTRVKEYASFMFKTFEGANRSGKISYDEFKQWLSMHPVILKVFDDTFHQNIWSTQNTEETGKISSPFDEFDKEKTSPHENNTLKTSTTNGAMVPEHLKYREKPAECSGYLFKKGKKSKSWQKRYFELYEHFMFYYEKKNDKIPKGILFLEGCYIEATKDYNNTHKYGLVITHKSDSYEPHTLYCNTKAEFDEWMSHLKLFQSSTVMDLYSFKEKIGTGKFSVVYRAITKDAKQNEYAVKVIEKKCLKPEEKEFLLSETSVMKILDHPSMIKLIDTVETKTHIYIVTEIVKDGDLFDYIITREYLEEHTASFIMKQLLISIYYLHGLGIIHRDIKPENILITLDHEEIKELKIIDFGFAKLVNEGVSVTETCGTPNYVAPEVLRGCGYDKRADIFSLGVIMYLMVRGLLPFDDHEVNTILKNTLKGEVPMEDEHWRNVSPECKDLLTKFLAKNPAERIDIRDALKHPWIKDRENLKKYEGVNRRKEGEY